MLVWLSWQSSSLVMSRSPVRIRPQAPKRKTAAGRFFFLMSLSGVEVYARRVNPATSSKSDRILLNTVTFEAALYEPHTLRGFHVAWNRVAKYTLNCKRRDSLPRLITCDGDTDEYDHFSYFCNDKKPPQACAPAAVLFARFWGWGKVC